jgi:hypothetical protein
MHIFTALAAIVDGGTGKNKYHNGKSVGQAQGDVIFNVRLLLAVFGGVPKVL